MKRLKGSLLTSLMLVFLMLAMLVAPAMVAAQPTVDVQTISSFAVLAGTTITNIGTTTISGNGGMVGLHPGTSFTGQETLTSSGAFHVNDIIAIAAKASLVTAYDDAAGRMPTMTIASELGGATLTPGVYDSGDGKFSITGTLTLDAQGDPNAVFIFKMATTLTTITGSNVNLINAGRYDRVFWQVGTSATLGTGSNFYGSILALDSITATTGATIRGQLLARNGAVTLDSNTIINAYGVPVVDDAVLYVIKNVINNDGGTAVPSDFTLRVKTAAGIEVVGSPAPGAAAPGTAYTLPAGSYVITEDAHSGYTLSFSGDSDANGNITLAAGDVKTVTLTNNDNSVVVIPPAMATLHVIKNVINNDGGTAVPSDFTLRVKTAAGVEVAGSPAPGAAAPGTAYTLPAGSYTISEDAHSGYTLIISGTNDVNGNITLAPGDVKTVTLTNNDIAVVVVPPVTETETGGQLPDTSTNLYAILMFGATLTLGGAMVWKTRKYVR